MDTIFTPTCVHCGNTIDHPEKAYCTKCGKTWSDIIPSFPPSEVPVWMLKENDLFSSARSYFSVGSVVLEDEPEASVVEAHTDIVEEGQTHQESEEAVSVPLEEEKQTNQQEEAVSVPLERERQINQQEETVSVPSGGEKQEHQQTEASVSRSLEGIIEPSSPRAFSTDEILERLHQLQEQIPQSLLMLHEATPPWKLLSLDEILEKLHMLRAKIQQGEARQYFPGDRQDNAEMLLTWRSHVEQVYKTIEFLEGLSIEPEYTNILRSSLAEMSHYLDFTQPYRVTLVGYAGTNMGMLLGTLLGEDIFVDLFRLPITAVRVLVNFCEKEEQEKLVISFSDEDRPDEVFVRNEWQTISSELENSPQGPSGIVSIEVNVRTHTHPLLPVGSLFVAVLSNGVNETETPVLLDEDLQKSDAIILLVNTPYFPIGVVRHLTRQIMSGISINKNAKQVSEMLFVAASNEEQVISLENMNTLGKTLHLLDSVLPQQYGKFHHHGPGKGFFFYPIQIKQAFFAMKGLQKESIEPELQEEAAHYYESARTNYDQLKYLEPDIPALFEAQRFEEMTQEQHKSMLFLSSVSELTHDLQQFLREHRTKIQLVQVEDARIKSLELIEELCWQKLEGYGVHISNRSLDTTERALKAFESKRVATYRIQIAKRMSTMQAAWNEALREFEIRTRMDKQVESAFHRELAAAHQRAGEYVLRRIQKGYFDRYFEMGTRRSGIVSSLAIDRLGVEVHLWDLLGKLRISLHTAVEEELKKPAYALAQSFLEPLEQRERRGGPLNITELAFNESILSLDEILKQYYVIKQEIYEKARHACQWITFSELLNDERRLSFKTPVVSQFITFVQAYEGEENEFYQQAHEHLQTLLLEMQKDVAERTERAIVDSLRYELDKLDMYEVYDHNEQEEQSIEPGAFSVLIQELEDRLVEHLHSSEDFGRKLDTMLYPDAKHTTFWWNLLKDVQEIKGMRSVM